MAYLKGKESQPMQFKNITCATIVTDGQFYIIAHPTGRSLKKGNWDLPKGRVEEGESEKDCAIRELREETGIIALRDQMHYLGLYPYNSKKDMSLFVLYLTDIKDLSSLTCTSSFTNKQGEVLLEMDQFTWATLGDWKMLYNNIQVVLGTIEDILLSTIKNLMRGDTK